MINFKGFLKNFGTKEVPNFFLALEIYGETIKSALWQVIDNQTQVVKLGAIEEFEASDDQAFIQAVDQSFSHAVGEQEIQPTGVIFGLPENWLVDNQVKEEHKPRLKLVCEKFDLKPLGFVQSQEALLQYFRLKEGVPLNAVFVRLLATEISIWLINNGQIIGEQSVGRSKDLGADIEEGLARFKQVSSFPPRIILFDSDTIDEDLRQQVDSYEWQERLAFLHVPKVETLAPTITIEAVAISGGSEVAKSLGFEISPKQQLANKTQTSLVSRSDPEVESESKPQPEDLGFIQDQDIANVGPEPVELPQPEPKIKPEPIIESPAQSESVEFQPAKNNNSLNKLKSLLGLMLIPFKKGLTIFRKINLRKRSMAGIFALIGSGLVVILAGLVAAWWYLPKAEVTIYLEPKILEKNIQLVLNPNITEPNLDKQIIPAVLEMVSVEDNQTTSTTGTGLVGDPASGGVIIYNKTDLKHTFEAGTILIGPDNNIFKLDNEISVASQSAHDEGVDYGKVTAEITATFIGPDGNLPAGSEFSFKEYPETVYSAKAEIGLTGGTSREVQTVDEADQEKLLNDLTDKLTQKATDQLNQKLANKVVLKESLTTEIEKENFNHEVGEETNSLNLDLKIKAQGLAYSPEIFNSLLFKTLEDQVPSGFSLYQENINTQIKDIVLKKDETGQLEVVVKAKLIPQINRNEVLENLIGRYPPLVQDYLKTLPNFAAADIGLKPSLPAKLNTLPHVKQNINLKVEVKD